MNYKEIHTGNQMNELANNQNENNINNDNN